MAPTFEVYSRTDDRYAWRLRADNGQVIATDGGQGYEDRAECARMGARVITGLYAPVGLVAP